jgi:hypothetical protein
MLRLTLDTSCVIHGAEAQPHGAQIDELVELAGDGRVGLWITTALATTRNAHRRTSTSATWLG